MCAVHLHAVRVSLCDLVHIAHARPFMPQPATDNNEMGFEVSHPLFLLSCKYLTDRMKINYSGLFLRIGTVLAETVLANINYSCEYEQFWHKLIVLADMMI